jgi:hypothetical protein
MNKLITNIPERNFRALAIIAAHFDAPSANAVVLAAIDAMVAEVCEREPLVRAAIELSGEERELPERVSVTA